MGVGLGGMGRDNANGIWYWLFVNAPIITSGQYIWNLVLLSEWLKKLKSFWPLLPSFDQLNKILSDNKNLSASCSYIGKDKRYPFKEAFFICWFNLESKCCLLISLEMASLLFWGSFELYSNLVRMFFVETRRYLLVYSSELFLHRRARSWILNEVFPKQHLKAFTLLQQLIRWKV